ncbi:MAG: peptidyl-prolyl cis-trans isomerase [Armatimonadota bacterium]
MPSRFRTVSTLTAAVTLALAVAPLSAAPAAKAPAKKPAAKPAPKPAAPKSPAGVGPDLPSALKPHAPAFSVNGEVIAVSTYVDRLSLTFGPDLREMLVEEALIRQEAKKRKITATAQEIQATADRRYRETLRPPLETEEKLAEELKRKRGWTLADYKKVLRDQAPVAVLREKLAASLVKPSDVTAEMVQEYYTQNQARFTIPDTVRISHILIRRDRKEGEAAARETAEKLLTQLQVDGDFAELAKKHSDDKLTAAGGGTVPLELTRSTHPFGEAFEAAVFNAEKGLVGEVVPSSLGFHVVKVDERKPGRALPLEEVREHIHRELLAGTRNQKLQELMIRLRNQAKIETGKF